MKFVSEFKKDGKLTTKEFDSFVEAAGVIDYGPIKISPKKGGNKE